MVSELLAPGVERYDFPEELAQDIIKMLEKDTTISWDRSLTGFGNENEMRTSQQLNFESEVPFAAAKVRDVFVKCVNDYIERYDIKITQDEGLTLLKYSESKKYDYHADSDWTMYRTLSALIYLNPQAYEGGETHFKLFDLSVKPEKPSIVLFPSNYAYLHAAMPVIKGTKYVFVTWMNDLPPGFAPIIIANIAGSVGIMNGPIGGHSH